MSTDALEGRVALVTGGTRGIGAAISESLMRSGATVAAGYSSNRERAEAFRAALGADASVHRGNVGEPDDCRRVAREVIEQHGRLDILVNNAGVTADRPILTMSVEDWHAVLRINLSGTFYMSQPVLAHMLERGSGRIVNISSIIGETGNIGQANYAASKAGLFGLTKTMAREAAFALAKSGPAKVVASPKAAIPVRRMGRPAEVARVVGFLAADESSYITGQVWGVNGGLDM